MKSGFTGPVIIGLLLLVALVIARIVDPPLLQDLRLRVFDVYQRLAPRPYQQAPVRVVEIDDETLARLGQWPWPRTLVAQLIDRLGQLGSAAIALDIVFAEPDRLSPSRLLPAWAELPGLDGLAAFSGPLPDFDLILAETLSRRPVVGGFALTHTPDDTALDLKTGFALVGPDPVGLLTPYSGAVVNLPVLNEAFSGIGAFSLAREQIVRRLPLIQAKGEQLVPGLSTEALRVAQRADTLAIRSAASGDLALGTERIRIGDLDIPVTADGQIWLHYTRAQAERSVPAWRILEDTHEELAALFNGHIVLIGASATGLGDFAPTPLNPVEPGVLIHAQAIEQMILGWFLERPFWADGAETMFLLALGVLLILLMPRLGAGWCALLALLATGAALAGSWLAFTRYKLLLDPVFPAIAILLIYLFISFAVYLRTERQRAWIRQAFSQYLAPDLVKQLVEHPERLNLGGETRTLTFLFSDIAGFTAMTESLAPAQLVRVLNAYLGGACDVVMAHGGTIDKIVGDAIHAIFNAPPDQPDHARRAVRCALALDDFARDFSAHQQREGINFGITRIGVNTGPAVVGNFGGEQRFDYTAHGDAINTAARLEAANKRLGTTICVAASTAEHCPEIAFRPLGTLMLRGKAIGVDVFEPMTEGMLNDYQDAYELLRAGNPAAVEAFAELAESYPDDPVIALHHRRLREGARDTVIRADS